MWSLWQKAKTYSQLPSKILGEEDSIAAWMLDSAVTYLGVTIENALEERVKVGVGNNVEYKPRYTLARLLDQGFKLPRTQTQIVESSGNPWLPLMAQVGRKNSNVRMWKYSKPVD